MRMAFTTAADRPPRGHRCSHGPDAGSSRCHHLGNVVAARSPRPACRSWSIRPACTFHPKSRHESGMPGSRHRAACAASPGADASPRAPVARTTEPPPPTLTSAGRDVPPGPTRCGSTSTLRVMPFGPAAASRRRPEVAKSWYSWGDAGRKRGERCVQRRAVGLRASRAPALRTNDDRHHEHRSRPRTSATAAPQQKASISNSAARGAEKDAGDAGRQ